MAKASVYNQTGQKVAEAELNPNVFGVSKIDPYVVYTAVRAQRNNLRRAIAHTQNRGEVAGSGKKPWKQKGTGRARAGSIRSPLWRGGGVTFGPRSNRNFSVKLNRSAFRKALFTILSDKLINNKVAVLENFDEVEKTSELQKRISTIANSAGMGKKLILIIDRPNQKIQRSARNLKNIKVLPAQSLNVIDLISHDLIITKEAINVIEKIYLK